jgi:hypothetical protein
MASKTKSYRWVKFPPEVLREALPAFERYLPEAKRTGKSSHRDLDLANGDHWEHNTDDEHFSDYRREDCLHASWRVLATYAGDLIVRFYGPGTPTSRVTVELPERHQVEQVFEVFEAGVERGRINRPPVRPVIFIGHGHSRQWIDLRDHLRDHHGLECVAFESGPRAGR